MLNFPPRGLSNLVAQSDQLAPLLIQMSGVRLEQRKHLIGHGEVMLHLAPARISYEIRKATDQTRNFLTPQAMLGHSGNGKRAVWH